MKQRTKEEDPTVAFVGKAIEKGTYRASQLVDEQTACETQTDPPIDWRGADRQGAQWISQSDGKAGTARGSEQSNRQVEQTQPMHYPINRGSGSERGRERKGKGEESGAGGMEA